MMESEKLILKKPVNKKPEVINTDELIPDFSFLYKIRQMNLVIDLDGDNYGFCFEW